MLSVNLYSIYMKLISATPMPCYVYAPHDRWIRFMMICYVLKYEVLDSENQDLSNWENTVGGCFEDETNCESEELDLYMSPSSYYHSIHSHLISSIPCPRMEYPPNPTSSFECLLRGYVCHLLRSVCNSFDSNFFVMCLPWVTKTTFESLRSSLGKQDHSVRWNPSSMNLCKLNYSFLFVVWCTFVCFATLPLHFRGRKFFLRGE